MDEINKIVDIGNISKYNSGALINLRLNELWQDAHKHKRKGKYSDWNGDLDAVWCELAGDVKEDSEKDKDFMKINLILAAYSPIINWDIKIDFKVRASNDLRKKGFQYFYLIKKEVFLRRLQNIQGKGTAYDDDDDSWE
ncbi:hypothetical protein LCGC14_0912180 [marine sediment metagenome]|uniref:Uncharacterized protein n=1 Tax=marine sediment metagenome TaxID=412755 RepID=A0A0F9RC65_9ZZZZ